MYHLEKSPGLAPSSRHDLGFVFRRVQHLGKARFTFCPSGRTVDSLMDHLAFHGVALDRCYRGFAGSRD